MKNKFFSKIFVSLICLPLIFCGGCVFFDSSSTDTQISSVMGYKVCYDDNNYELDNTFELYSRHILTELYSNFAIPSDETNKSKLAVRPLVSEIKNYDKIRQQVAGDAYNNTAWKWTIAKTTPSANVCPQPENAVEYYSVPSLQTAYYDAYINTYLDALTIVILQINMGLQPTIFTININQTAGLTKVFSGDNEITSNSQILSNLKSEFKTKGKYIGFTEENILTFRQYILTNIIGESITSGHNNIVLTTGNISYENLLTNILKTSPVELIKPFNSPYPKAKCLDITNTSLNVASSGDALAHIPALEYNSIAVMAKSNCNIISLMLALESEQALKVNVKIFQYLTSSGQKTELGSKLFDLKGGKWNSNDDIIVNFSNSQTFSTFNNKENLSATISKNINNTNLNSTFYSLNQKNVGVLDGAKVGSSYFEIVFEVENSASTYTPFKVGIFNMVVS